MKSSPVIECVPNFSEGKDPAKIRKIEDAVRSVPSVSLLNTDPGRSTNRTVVTFAGHPDDVLEAAFRAIEAAGQVIDMRTHKGEHPRMGATDVCPLIPISGISLEETSAYAKRLAERVGRELGIPVYLYEASASAPHRKNLADIRSGEYEGLEEKMKLPEWQPDFGPDAFNAKSGATVIGARDFLIAYNVNLNTASVALANEVAFDIRENGRPVRDPATGKLMRNEQGEVLRTPGLCPSVKAIGWYIDEYGYAQVSMNLTDLKLTPLHIAFEACRQAAEKYGLHVTGSELVGLVPKQSLLDAGIYFLKKQRRSCGLSEEDLIRAGIHSLGLSQCSLFDPEKRIIENMISEKQERLAGLSLKQFARETAADTPTPGGGSVSAYVGALGASLSTMVANLSMHKKGFEDRYELFNEKAISGAGVIAELLKLVDEDTLSFDAIIQAYRLPKSNPEEKKARKKAIHKATIGAIMVPMRTIEAAMKILPLNRLMVEQGNTSSVSDAGVGALCIETAVRGAAMNVRINAATLDKEEEKNKYITRADRYESETVSAVREILSLVEKRMGASS